MRWILVAGALVLLWPSAPALAGPPFGATQDPQAGSRVFGAKACARCHAVNGIGGGVGPDLGRVPNPRSFYDLAAAMWNHLPQMAERMRRLGIPRPRLDPRETGDLIAFLYTLNYLDPPGDPAAGGRLFRQKKCIVCHQVGGTGGVVGPNLDVLGRFGSPIFVAAAMWNHGPQMAEAMRARNVRRPTFQDSELLDLIAYLRAAAPAPAEGPLHVLPGRADEGRRLFVEKRCIDCHQVGGQGGRVGPDLAERGLQRSLTQFAAAMWNKAPAMTKAMKARGIGVPNLRAEEMGDLVAYLYAVRYFAEAGDPRQGRALATDKGCLRCHPVSGRGGRVAPDLARTGGLDSPVGVVTAMWNHAGKMQEKMREEKVPWPLLSGKELADLMTFLQASRQGR